MKASNNNFYIQYDKNTSHINEVNNNFPFYNDDNYLILIEGVLLTEDFDKDKNKDSYKNIVKILSTNKYIGNIARTINGNWSLIVYKKITKELFVIRDKFGSFPIYYYDYKDKICFSNNINVLKNNNDFKIKADETTIARYIGYGELHTTKRTFYEKIKRIPPNNILKIKDNFISEYTYNSYIPKYEKKNDKDKLINVF